MENTMPSLREIKGAALKDGAMGGCGYLFSIEGVDAGSPLRHCLVLAGTEPFSFLFGLSGLGYHYRLDVRPEESTLALYHIRDGIPLYLHHFATHIPPDAAITVDLFHSQIRVGINGFQVMHAVGDPHFDPRIGFSPLAPVGFTLPKHSATPLLLPALAWLCLGDGFSNARWRNRNFLSWPERVFGHREDWFNGCVAAGNSRRVLQLAWDFAPLCHDSSVLLAVGSDDQIEGETYADFETRLAAIIQRLRSSRLKSIHLATLPPRASAMEATRDWSARIREFAANNNLGILDFHGWLAADMSGMVRGEYPGASAQALLASRVAETLGLTLPSSCPAEIHPNPPAPLTVKFLRKAHRWLDNRLADFPGILH